MLMLASHNILNPANGAPVTVPSQDMVLGLYYTTKERKSSGTVKVKGEGMKFYSPEECIIAHNEGRVDLHAQVEVKTTVKEEGKLGDEKYRDYRGRILFNQVVPEEAGYYQRTAYLRNPCAKLSANVLKECGIAKTAKFLDEIKDLGFKMAFQRRTVVQPRRC
jgi:DNA-directed RNA polymerase subunit beta'